MFSQVFLMLTLPDIAVAMLILTVIAIFLAGLTCLILLKKYRRAVVQTMGKATAAKAAGTRTTDKSTAEVVTASEPKMALTRPVFSVAQLKKMPWHHAVRFVVGGFAYAIIMSLALSIGGGSSLKILRVFYLFWLYLWPTVIVINLVTATSRKSLWRSVGCYFEVLLGLSWLAQSLSSLGFSVSEGIWLWIFFNLPTTVLLIIFLNLRVRAIGPLVLIFMVFPLVGAALFYVALVVTQGIWIPALAPVDVALRNFANLSPNMSANISLAAAILFALILGMLVLGLIGWITLQWIRGQYERKQLSDQLIIIFAIWTLFAFVHSLNLIFKGNVWGLAAVIALGACVNFTLRPLGQGAKTALDPVNSNNVNSRGLNLLLLRVFDLGKRSERLFRSLSLYWRHIGSVQMIAGPDLVNSNIEPHEFLDFVTGKLARRFVDSTQTLEKRLAERDLTCDHDGRYRVNDFFCYDNTWKPTLKSLLSTCDVILMDLRSFSPSNKGCIYEIKTLVECVPFEKFVLLIDSTTDKPFLHRTLQDAWEEQQKPQPSQSLNHAKPLEQIIIFHYKGIDANLQTLLDTLLKASEPSSTFI